MCAHQCSCTRFWTFVYHTNSQGHSGYQPINQRVHTPLHALCVNTFYHKQDIFGHRAVFICRGSRHTVEFSVELNTLFYTSTWAQVHWSPLRERITSYSTECLIQDSAYVCIQRRRQTTFHQLGILDHNLKWNWGSCSIVSGPVYLLQWTRMSYVYDKRLGNTTAICK